MSEIESLRFFAVLGFESLSPVANLVWNGLVIFTVLWLIYRLLKDMFKLSIIWRPLSRKELFGLVILVIWVISAAITALQFAILATVPLANPKLEVSRYYTPFYMESNDSSTLVMLNDVEENKVTLDLSRSVFADPLSIYEMGQASEYGTKYVGASYFNVENSSLGQKTIELRFCGNGTDQIEGWFAYRIRLENPIPMSENLTVLLLLKLIQSSDSSAWMWYKIDLLNEENFTYSIVFKFHDVPGNYVCKNEDGTISYYLIGSVVNWKFYQFNLNNLFSTSFSQKPCYITGVEYVIGAESDNDIKACFLLAKISPNPLEINDVEIKDVRPTITLECDNVIKIKGVHLGKLLVTSSVPLEKENVNFQLALLGISRIESYRWNMGEGSNETLHKVQMTFDVTRQAKRLILDSNDITSQIQESTVYSLDLDTSSEEVTFVVMSEIDAYFVAVVILVPIIAFFAYVVFYLTRRILK